ncbi:MAG: hypothetical protein M0P12_00225 [Paludibacteraceae bacterium]|jgi:hypothetical protein|nr:hypothetical protein [Paludibacteraceae bacterium]MCK9615562.1 hypothetical protein [Candidatus Omnitrophota bacterium]
MNINPKNRFIMQYIKEKDQNGRMAPVGILASGLNNEGKIIYSYSLANTHPTGAQKASGINPDKFDMKTAVELVMKRLDDGGMDTTKFPSSVSALMKVKNLQVKISQVKTRKDGILPANFIRYSGTNRGYVKIRGFKERSEAYFKDAIK